MIAFGCSVNEAGAYLRYSRPGIMRAAEPDSEIYCFAAVETASRSWNLILDAAAAREDLEALVMVHPHAEITDPDFCGKVRAALRDPEVAVVGCVGAADIPGIAWWEGTVSCGQVTHRYTENGGGELPAFSWAARRGGAPAEVDAVDGFLIVLSPWAVRNVRFDEELIHGHGYEVDYCLQVRSAGRKVVTADLRVNEHRGLQVLPDLGLWVESHIAVARKWEGRLLGGDDGRSWEQRARRAEAERDAARSIAYFERLGYDARIEALEQALGGAQSSFSWRVTAPLRRINKWRRDRLPEGEATIPA